MQIKGSVGKEKAVTNAFTLLAGFQARPALLYICFTYQSSPTSKIYLNNKADQHQNVLRNDNSLYMIITGLVELTCIKH